MKVAQEFVQWRCPGCRAIQRSSVSAVGHQGPNQCFGCRNEYEVQVVIHVIAVSLLKKVGES